MPNATPSLDTIFCAAIEIGDAADRAAYLAQACGGDDALRQRVEALVAANFRAGSFLEPLTGPANATAAFAPTTEEPGTAIGPYKLLQKLGEGGMGTVYMAEQLEPVRRRVALKIIKAGMDSAHVIARFEQERQALALMDHPHIAKVLDAGATAGGRPYFVMELVKGVPITKYCDHEHLTPKERLELFLPVCQAVQHAHQKGIIHRDLKPSNVLIALYDGKPVPKVIDFGVAKATGQNLTEKTMFTEVGQVIGTLEYMAPEQAELNNLDIDTRADIYSLGVLLYELLTGSTPFTRQQLRSAAFTEMLRMIREVEPSKPSTKLSSSEDLQSIAAKRKLEPARLCKLVTGELDWIVMKALEKDRGRRYETANGFAADVQRYLDDKPVQACPASAGYRLRKFWRRNRRLLVTAGVIAAVLVSATAVSTWQAVKARDAERRAAEETAIARAVNEFLRGDLLGEAASAPPGDREFGGEPYLTVKEALDRAAPHIGARFQDQPLVEAAIRSTIGIAYNQLNECRLAVPHLERAVVLRKAHLGPDHPDTFQSIGALAFAYTRVGRHGEGIALHQHLLENRKALRGPDHVESIWAVGALAKAYQHAGQLDASSRLWKQLLEKQRSRFGAMHPYTTGTMIELAYTYGMMGRFPESMTLFEEYFAMHKAQGPDPIEGWGLLTFAEGCQWAGKLDQADGPLREALAQTRKDKGSVNERNYRANIAGFLAVNLLFQQRYGEAEPFAREAVAMKHPGNLKSFYWVSALGAVLLGQQKYAEAEPLLLEGYEGLKQREALHPAVRRRLTQAGEWIVRFYEVTGQPEKARAWRDKVKPNLPDAAAAGVNAPGENSALPTEKKGRP